MFIRRTMRASWTASIALCPFTTHLVDAPLFRLLIGPARQNGLKAASQLMVDKITTVAKSKMQTRVGRLADEDIVRLNRVVLVFLGLAAGTFEGMIGRE
jgi:mRNA interferase MazF